MVVVRPEDTEMANDDTLAGRIRPLISQQEGFSERKMFGGVCFMINGNMCVGTWKDSLIVRLDKKKHDETLAQPQNLDDFARFDEIEAIALEDVSPVGGAHV